MDTLPNQIVGNQVQSLLTLHFSVTPCPLNPQISDFTESSWPGYSPVSLSRRQSISPDDGIDAVALQGFVQNQSGVAQVPVSFWIESSAGGQRVLLFAANLPFGAMVEIGADGDWVYLLLNAWGGGS